MSKEINIHGLLRGIFCGRRLLNNALRKQTWCPTQGRGRNMFPPNQVDSNKASAARSKAIAAGVEDVGAGSILEPKW